MAVDITQFYPPAVYNFDVAPAIYQQFGTGPIRLLLQARQNALNAGYGAIQALQPQLTVQTATGVYLDAHGIMYGVLRAPGESDQTFRARILSVLPMQSLTIPAIQNAVQLFFNNLNAQGITAPLICTVWDSQSDPVDAATYGITPNYFVIELTFALNRAFIAGRSFVGRSFVINTTNDLLIVGAEPQYSWFTDLNNLVLSKHAAGTIPLYWVRRTISAFPGA